MPHNGRNTGAGEARILSVFMGAEGVPNTEMLPATRQRRQLRLSENRVTWG